MSLCRSTFLRTPCQNPAHHTGPHRYTHSSGHTTVWDDNSADTERTVVANEIIDAEDFRQDLAYLNGLADTMIELYGPTLRRPGDITIYDRLKANLTLSARSAVFGYRSEFPDFQQLWDAA